MKKLVSYVDEEMFVPRLIHKVVGGKTSATAMFVENALGIYKNSWWYLKIGKQSFSVYPADDDSESQVLKLLWAWSGESEEDLLTYLKRKKLI